MSDDENRQEDVKGHTYVPDLKTSASKQQIIFMILCISDLEIILADKESEVTTKRISRKPARYGFNNLWRNGVKYGFKKDCGNIPFEEALHGPECQYWKAKKEGNNARRLNSFQESGAQEYVDRPIDKTVVQCKWVFKKKHCSDSNDRYRAMLVAKGFS